MGRKKKAEVSKHFEEQKKERQNRITHTIKKTMQNNEDFWKKFNKALNNEK